MRDEQWLESIRHLVVGLQDAFAAVDIDEARELRKLWRQLEKDSGKSGENPLFDQVRPVFVWLEQMDIEEKREYQYHQALSDLAEEIEEGDSLAELHRFRDAVLAFEPSLPDEMRERRGARARALSRTVGPRRRQLILASSLAAVAIVVRACIWFVRSQARSSGRRDGRDG